MTEPEVGMCWFCHRTVPWSSLIAGYDTWDEQRLACNTCNDAIRWLNDHGHVVSRSAPPPATPGLPDLDEAWNAAEAALPEGWTGPFVGPHHRGDYWANAWLTAGGHPHEQAKGSDNIIVPSLDAHGDPPAAALQALAAALAETPGEPHD